MTTTPNETPDDLPIDDEQLQDIVAQLQLEEEASKQATLSSLDSFQAWLLANPMFRNTGLIENLAQFAPALFTVVRRLFGV